ncbi:unnamed protein product [Scytosiphon promiscuus]
MADGVEEEDKLTATFHAHLTPALCEVRGSGWDEDVALPVWSFLTGFASPLSPGAAVHVGPPHVFRDRCNTLGRSMEGNVSLAMYPSPSANSLQSSMSLLPPLVVRDVRTVQQDSI